MLRQSDLLHGIKGIDKDNPEITLGKQHVIYMVDVDASVKKKYNELFGSKLITPDEKKLVL